MKGLVCHAPEQLSFDDVAEMVVPEGWVPLDVQRVGICGTDYHIYTGNQPYLAYPRIMGHEVSARVGAGYSDGRLSQGDLVILNPYLACGTCHACKLSKPNCCEAIQVLGVHRDGAMVERIAVPASNLIAADGLSADQAAMVEFLAIGRHAVARTRVLKDAPTLVVGAGPIGLATALFARIDGAAVTIADVSDEKLKMVRDRFGFETLNILSAEPDSLTSSATHVFDATGNIKAMNGGLSYVANGGTYTLVSVVKEDLVFADPEFHKRETTLISSRNALNADFEFVIEAIRSGKIDTDQIKTHETTLERAAQDLPLWSQDRDTVIKAIISVV
ncbi:MAG: zinc-binding alcohol dehydrogenase family protein [Rhodobacteraceae bacterium]|nr:zinc-binding alcohol dehydrogenase family protein [Paracoccaceae bacterium]